MNLSPRERDEALHVSLSQTATDLHTRVPGRPSLFPPHFHLNVVTEQRVHAWYLSGLKSVFSSRTRGIAAAREARDGTGLLAVADSQVVFLQNAKGTMRNRQKLDSSEGQLRLLEYLNDSKELFFTTSLQESVLRYSIVDDRLLEFSCTHPSPPTALAVSSKSAYLLSTSRLPPVLYLQDLSSGRPPINMKPRASDAYVTVVAFHPNREAIFLVAYSDGSISVHDALRILSKHAGANDGALGQYKRAHHVTNARSARPPAENALARPSASPGAIGVSITAASFMAGHNLRVVSVAGDGKCRIIDFEAGLKVVRTWHLYAACTSLSVLAVPEGYNVGKDRDDGGLVTSSQLHHRQTCVHVIALGTIDGFVFLYDDLGLLRHARLLHSDRRRIIHVEWISNQKHRAAGMETVVARKQIHFLKDLHNTIVPQSKGERITSSATDSMIPACGKISIEPMPQSSLLTALKRCPVKISSRSVSGSIATTVLHNTSLANCPLMPGASLRSLTRLDMGASTTLIESGAPEHQQEEPLSKPAQQGRRAIYSERLVSRLETATRHAQDILQDVQGTTIANPVAVQQIRDNPQELVSQLVEEKSPMHSLSQQTRVETSALVVRQSMPGQFPPDMSPQDADADASENDKIPGRQLQPCSSTSSSLRFCSLEPEAQQPYSEHEGHLPDQGQYQCPSGISEKIKEPHGPVQKDVIDRNINRRQLKLNPPQKPVSHIAPQLPPPPPRQQQFLGETEQAGPTDHQRSLKRELMHVKSPDVNSSDQHVPSPVSSSLTTWSRHESGYLGAGSTDSSKTARSHQSAVTFKKSGDDVNSSPKTSPVPEVPLLSPCTYPPPRDLEAHVGQHNHKHAMGCSCGCAEAVRDDLNAMRLEVGTLKDLLLDIVKLQEEMMSSRFPEEEVRARMTRPTLEHQEDARSVSCMEGILMELERYRKIVDELGELNRRV